MDCPLCGKRMATTARTCHHCAQKPARTNRSLAPRNDFEIDSHQRSEAHMSAEAGGYDADSDFDYNDYVEHEFGPKKDRTSVKTWVWLTAWLLILAILLPFVLTIVR